METIKLAHKSIFPIKQAKTSYTSKVWNMGYGFKRSSKRKTNNSSHPFPKLTRPIQLKVRTTNPNMTNTLSGRLDGKFVKTKHSVWWQTLRKTNGSTNFLRGTVTNRNNMRTPLHFRKERQSQHLKLWFSLNTEPWFFTWFYH